MPLIPPPRKPRSPVPWTLISSAGGAVWSPRRFWKDWVTDQMVWNTYSVSDQAWIAAGKVGEKAGKIFERNFDRPPTVRLESGTPVGVLVMNVKDR